MFDRDAKTFASTATAGGSLHADAAIPLHGERSAKPRGLLSAVAHSVYDTVCVCIDAIIGRYDR